MIFAILCCFYVCFNHGIPFTVVILSWAGTSSQRFDSTGDTEFVTQQDRGFGILDKERQHLRLGVGGGRGHIVPAFCAWNWETGEIGLFRGKCLDFIYFYYLGYLGIQQKKTTKIHSNLCIKVKVLGAGCVFRLDTKSIQKPCSLILGMSWGVKNSTCFEAGVSR